MLFSSVWSIAALISIPFAESLAISLFMAVMCFGITFTLFLRWVWLPCRERFSLCQDGIQVHTGQRVCTLVLPPELLLIVTHASLMPANADSYSARKCPPLKGRYAVTLLLPMPLPEALKKLHPHPWIHGASYSSSLLSAFAPYQYLYSFVLQEDLLAQLARLRSCTLILPEECVEKLTVPAGMCVYIDQN